LVFPKPIRIKIVTFKKISVFLYLSFNKYEISGVDHFITLEVITLIYIYIVN